MLLSFAAYRAAYQLARDPYLWERTEHGGRPALSGSTELRPRNNQPEYRQHGRESGKTEREPEPKQPVVLGRQVRTFHEPIGQLDRVRICIHTTGNQNAPVTR